MIKLMIKRNAVNHSVVSKSILKKVLGLLTALGLTVGMAGSGAGGSGTFSGIDCKTAGTEQGIQSICEQGVFSIGSMYSPENSKGQGIFAGQYGKITAASEGLSVSAMGSVPYFRDDAGQNTQAADGYLYGYWNGRLCRVDLETLEETVLYEALSPQHGDFCIWGDYIYFMVVPHVSVVGKIHGSLYRVKCDGSEEAVCLASVRMPRQGDGGQYYGYYTLDTYEDILYLIDKYGDEENLYFRLCQDGSIARVPESETLYGQLPARHSARWYYNTLITLPYAMRNYGYVFAKDEKENLVRIDLGSGKVEAMDSLQDYVVCVVTNDAVIVVKGDVWYRASLDDIHEISPIGKSGEGDSYVAWDEGGLYFVSSYGEGSANLYFMDWQGDKTTLQADFGRMQRSPMEYFDGNYYYYVEQKKGDSIIKRLNLTGSENAEEVAVYEENPLWDITTKESIDYDWADKYTGARVEYSLTRVCFKEDTGAFGVINLFLDNLYEQDIQSVKEYKEILREQSDSEDSDKWATDYMECMDGYEVCYMDENYVGIEAYWYQYWKGAAHGMYGSYYYMFDRHTGKQVHITDVVNNTPEEICEIAAPYVEAVAAWGVDKEGWEAIFLEEGRFYLSEEGIGFHFDTYEIDCYAAGAQEIIVPYNMFEMKR